MEIIKAEMQDNAGNAIYPYTSAEVVFDANGKSLESYIKEMENS